MTIPKNIKELLRELGRDPVKGRYKYECPNCHESKLSVARGGEKYDCYGCHENTKLLSLLWEEWRSINGHSRSQQKEHSGQNDKTLLVKESQPDSLFPFEWDDASKALSEWFGLSTNAREALEARGYSPFAIDMMKSAGWFSVPAGRTDVSNLGLPENFPGTQWWREESGLPIQTLNSPRIEESPGNWVSKEAIAIPRYEWDGLVTGYQLRLLGDVKKEDRYRYFCSKGSANGNKVRVWDWSLGGEEEIEERSLTVCDSRRLFNRRELTVDALNFVEANLKPHTCAYKHGGIWVGTNSNLFASNPAQLRNIYLNAQDLGLTIIRFHLDARTLPCEAKPEGNPGILINWARLAQFYYKNYPEQFKIEVYAYGDVDPDEIGSIQPDHCIGEFNAVFSAALERSKKLRRAAKPLLKGDRGCEWVKEIRRIQRWLHRKVLQFLNQQELDRLKIKKTTAIVLRSQITEWGETCLHAWPVENPPYLPYNPNNPDSINYTRHKHSKTALMPEIRLKSPEHYEAFHRDAYNAGWQHILNRTEAGGGKSHNTALLNPEAIGLEGETVQIDDGHGNIEEKEHKPRLFYFIDSPANPTNVALEKRSTRLPARAEKLYLNTDKQTPLGNYYIHSSNPDHKYQEIPNSGNCGFPDLHHYLNSLGYSPEFRYTSVCMQCPAMKDREKELNCQHYRSSMAIKDRNTGEVVTDSETGDDREFPFGFLSERVDVLTNESFIRLHHTQAPGKDLNEEKGTRSGISDTIDIVVHDDCRPQTEASYSVTAAACDRAARILRKNHEIATESDNPEDIVRTARQLEAFDKLLTRLGSVLENAKLGKYGLGDPQVRSLMAGQDNDNEGLWISAFDMLTSYCPPYDSYSNIVEKYRYSTVLERLRGACKGLGSNLGKIQETVLENRDKSQKELIAMLDGVATPQFLRPLMLAGLGYGSLRIDGEYNPQTGKKENKLTISIKDRSQVRNSRGAFNIQLDATMTKAEYSAHYGVRERDVVVLRQQPMDHSNLTIFQYSDMGQLAAGNWSDELINRQVAAISAAHQQAIAAGLNPDGIGLIAPKWLIDKGVFDHIIPRERQGWWFSHTRGTNVWQDCHTLCCIGSPRSHLGQLAVDWQVRTGEPIDLEHQDQHPEFRRWANGLIRKEQVQTAARLRSGRTEDLKSIHWFCPESLRFLEKAFPGCTVSDSKSRKLSPQAAPKVDRHLYALGEAIGQCIEDGTKPTQKTLAGMIDWSETRISEACKQLIQVLIDSGEVILTGRQWFKPFIKTFRTLYMTLIGERKFSDEDISAPIREFAEALLPQQLQKYLSRREAIVAAAQTQQDDTSPHQQLFDNAWHILCGMLRGSARDAAVTEKIVSLLCPEERKALLQVLMDVIPLNRDLDALEYAIDFSPG